MSKKVMSLILTLIIGITCISSVFTKTVFANEIKIEEDTIFRSSGPGYGGTEDIIDHETTWKYRVRQVGGKYVNIKFDRYTVRGSNGKVYHKVYASYYKLNGEFIN